MGAYPDCKVMTTKVDVIDPKQVDAWIASVVAEFGHLDGAANIAGGERKGNRKAEDRITEIVSQLCATRRTSNKSTLTEPRL